MTPRLLRGSVPARALCVGAPWLSPAETTRRALACWEPGATVYKLEDHLLVHLPTPKRVDCDDAPGQPFVETGGSLWGWAPERAEVESTPPGRVSWLLGGLVREAGLAALPQVDLAELLAVDAPFASVVPLGPPPPPLPVPTRSDARTLLGRPALTAEGVAAAAGIAGHAVGPPERPGWIQRFAAGLLARRAPPAAPGGSASAPAGAGSSTRVPTPPTGFLGGLLGVLSWLLGPPRAAPAAAPGPGLSPAPSPASRLDALLRHLAFPALAPWLGRKQRAYIQDLLARFEAGDLDAALRRAIPLGADDATPLPPALGLPSPRDDLALSFGPAPRAAGIGADTSVRELLRERYRRALAELIADGRVEDAVFVLVELLREPREAVDLLERHARWELAAKIAEHAGFAVEVVARLHVRAGKLDRAVSLARRSGAFPAVVAIVEAEDRDRGRALRAAWAAHLAAAGDPAGAVSACWPVEALRPTALRWLDAALEAGGPAGVRLLPQRLLVEPERFSEVRSQVEAVLSGDEPEDRRARLALSEGLRAAPSPGARALARPLLRRLVADRAAQGDVPATDMDALRLFANDPALAFDLPPPPPTPVRAPRDHPVDASDRGTAPVYDLAPLPRARMVLALGEAGCRIVGREGKWIHHFDEPTDALVMHDASTRALAVARRAGGARLARVDLVAGRSERWLDAPLSRFTTSYDGSFWFVAEGTRVLALDPLADRPLVLWSVDTGGEVTHLARTPAQLTVGVGGSVRQIWRYSLPNMRLLERADRAADDWPRTWAADGALLDTAPVRAGGEGHALLPMRLDRQGRLEQRLLPVPMESIGQNPLLARWSPTLTVVTLPTTAGVTTLVYHGLLHATLRVDLAGARAACVRVDALTVALGDDLGRALAFDHATGAQIRSVRT